MFLARLLLIIPVYCPEMQTAHLPPSPRPRDASLLLTNCDTPRPTPRPQVCLSSATPASTSPSSVYLQFITSTPLRTPFWRPHLLGPIRAFSLAQCMELTKSGLHAHWHHGKCLPFVPFLPADILRYGARRYFDRHLALNQTSLQHSVRCR